MYFFSITVLLTGNFRSTFATLWLFFTRCGVFGRGLREIRRTPPPPPHLISCVSIVFKKPLKLVQYTCLVRIQQRFWCEVQLCTCWAAYKFSFRNGKLKSASVWNRIYLDLQKAQAAGANGNCAMEGGDNEKNR